VFLVAMYDNIAWFLTLIGGEMKNVYKILVVNLNGRLFLKDLGVGGSRILE
jgi:hypothetical protein